MIIALALASYALITLLAGPQLLTRGGWRIFRPRLCLTLPSRCAPNGSGGQPRFRFGLPVDQVG